MDSCQNICYIRCLTGLHITIVWATAPERTLFHKWFGCFITGSTSPHAPQSVLAVAARDTWWCMNFKNDVNFNTYFWLIPDTLRTDLSDGGIYTISFVDWSEYITIFPEDLERTRAKQWRRVVWWAVVWVRIRSTLTSVIMQEWAKRRWEENNKEKVKSRNISLKQRWNKFKDKG